MNEIITALIALTGVILGVFLLKFCEVFIVEQAEQKHRAKLRRDK